MLTRRHLHSTSLHVLNTPQMPFTYRLIHYLACRYRLTICIIDVNLHRHQASPPLRRGYNHVHASHDSAFTKRRFNSTGIKVLGIFFPVWVDCSYLQRGYLFMTPEGLPLGFPLFPAIVRLSLHSLMCSSSASLVVVYCGYHSLFPPIH